MPRSRATTNPAMFAIIPLAVLLATCTAALAPAGGTRLDLDRACDQAMAVAPMFPTVAPWITGACGSAELIANLAKDPGSLTWLTGILKRL